MLNDMISIIVPIYNVEQYLVRCVESLIAQTYSNIEIILVDDGSKDSCPKICDNFARKDSRIRVIHKQNGGLSDARNCGLRCALGTYILYVDSDDYLELDSCSKLLRMMQDSVDFVVGAYKEITHNKTIIRRHSNIQSGLKYSSKEFSILSIKNNEWYAPAWLNLYRRQFLLENSLYFKEGILFEDHQILLRLWLSAENIVYLDYPFYNYVVRENSIITSGNYERKVEMSLCNWNEWMATISKMNDPIYQKYLYGILVKYYLSTCCSYNISGWKVKDMDFRFAFKYALNARERVKVAFFNFLPNLYNSI